MPASRSRGLRIALKPEKGFVKPGAHREGSIAGELIQEEARFM
jgi:hypothetical protein